ncbi:unnamed protein product [Adineta steineri]|uniref:ADP-ribosylglycohydrolase n=1 Tax=Adineta steineri TaxID=433720 RepID=A0A819U1J1_9BILA|nr:unnamed protein product [Adineta steineri]
MTNIQRFLDAEEEPLRSWSTIEDFENQPLISFDDAVEKLQQCILNLGQRINEAKQSSFDSTDDLNADEAAAICLYTLEQNDPTASVCTQLNRVLRTTTQNELKPWLSYLKLFITALDKLSPFQGTVYRGVHGDVSDQYQDELTWWGFKESMNYDGNKNTSSSTQKTKASNIPVFPSPHDRTLPHAIRLGTPQDPSSDLDTLNQVIGSLVGLAVGDALGASVECQSHANLIEHPVTNMQSGGTWGLKAGQWTDDTSMALCLASSLISKQGFDPYDQLVRYKWWFKHGFLSSTGHCFDVGSATRRALDEFSNRQKILKKRFKCRTDQEVDQLSYDAVRLVPGFNVNCSSPNIAGNGALMRLTPVPLFYFRSPSVAIEYAGRSAVITHGDRKAVDACRYYAALIVAAIHKESKEQLLSNSFYEEHKNWFQDQDLHPDILHIAQGSYKQTRGYEGGIRGKGYIVKALEAALWAFWSNNDSFETGVLAAIQLGSDTDTTAAIYGQLAGAFYGYDKIPQKWRRQLDAHDLLVSISHWLHFLGSQASTDEQQSQHITGEKRK